MDANVCDINHLDSDVLLPPRKRLLAGLKRQNLESSSRQLSPPTTSELDTNLNEKLRLHLNNPNLSPEEIAESSKSAAITAAKVARAARAAAEEKAVIAANAMAAAKIALELVASISEETESKDRHSKRNKLKKHIPMHLLYKKQHRNLETDEELARNLHRAMNSSPRISKNGSSSDLKNHKHKKSKFSPSDEKTRTSNGGTSLEENSKYNCNGNGNGESGKIHFEGCSPELFSNNVDRKASRICRVNQLEMDNGEAGPSQLREKNREAAPSQSREKIREALDDTSPSGRKRGRIKLKKLPLSICSYRDQASPKDPNRSPAVAEEPRGKSTAVNISLFSANLSSENVVSTETPATWKCQDLKAPECLKENKLMES